MIFFIDDEPQAVRYYLSDSSLKNFGQEYVVYVDDLKERTESITTKYSKYRNNYS